MKTKIIYFFLLFCFVSFSQELVLPLSNAGRQIFAGKLFLFGLTPSGSSLNLKVYSMGNNFKLDSITAEIKGKADDYLKLYADTLHGFLNIYVQKAKSRNVKVVRVSKSFSIHNVIEDVELTRLNSISFFEKEIFYSGKDVYTVKSTVSDTAGKQFYLNKYTLRSDKENFEYDAKWQFPFERKFIESAQIVSADKKSVFLFVNIDRGSKKGQWYLRVNAKEGKLIKAVKINEKGDTSAYVLHKLALDSSNWSHYLFGQKFSSKDYELASYSLNLSGKKDASFFLLGIDTLMELNSRYEFKIPVTDIVSQTNKGMVSGYLPKSNTIRYRVGEGFNIEMDIFRSMKNFPGCYRYSNTVSFNISEKEGSYQIQKTAIRPDPGIDQFFSDVQSGDFSGCLCLDSLDNIFRTIFKPLSNNSKIAVKKDATGNNSWLLSKTNSKKQTLVVSLLAPEKKVYKQRAVTEIPKVLDPFVEIISEKEVLIGKNEGEDKIRLQVFPW